MNRPKVRKFSLAMLTLALLIAAVGCSTDRNPLGVSDRASSDPLFRGSAAEVEIAGRVDAVDPGAREISLVGNPTLIVVQPGAEVVLRDDFGETSIELTAINPDDSLEARGQLQSGTLVADRIRVRRGDDSSGSGPEVEFHGRLATMNPDARTMTLVGNPTPITVLPNAEIVQKASGSEFPIRLTDFSPGDSVEVRGTMQADNSLAADRVRLRSSDDDDFASDLEFTSVITAIDYAAMTVTVAGRSEAILADTNTYIYLKVQRSLFSNPAGKYGEDNEDDDPLSRHERIAFTDLALGDTIEVYANVIGSNMLYAVVIELEDGAFESGLEVEFKDTLDFVDAATHTITFRNETFSGLVDENADLRGLNDEMLPLSDFTAGQLVEVKGFRISNDSIRVVHMHRDNN